MKATLDRSIRPERGQQTTDASKVMIADSTKPPTAARVDQGPDYSEISLWVGELATLLDPRDVRVFARVRRTIDSDLTRGGF